MNNQDSHSHCGSGGEQVTSYITAYFTQAPTLAVFYHVLELGEMPSIVDDR